MASSSPFCVDCGSNARWYDSVAGTYSDYCGQQGCSIKGTNVPPSTASYNYTPHQYPYYQTWYPQSQASYSSTPPLASNLLPSLHQAQASYAPSSSAGLVQVSYTTPAPQGYAQATYAYSTPSVQSSYGGSTSTQATPPLDCVAPKCSRPRWQDRSGNYSLFCGKTCRNNNPHLQQSNVNQSSAPTVVTSVGQSATIPNTVPATAATNLGLQACVICKIIPYDVARQSLFCGLTCMRTSEGMAPGIIEIPSSHPKFTDVANQFRTKWLHTNITFKPAKHIYLILGSAASTAKYNAYRRKVEQEGNFKSRGKSEGNENRRFHGTTRQCLLGDPGNTQMCSNTT
ncbi:hypothetical protein FRB91_005967, partial [Serendipita sp. 411]